MTAEGGKDRERRFSTSRRRLLTAIACATAAVLLWQPVLLGLAGFMRVTSPLERADFIVPLYHDGETVSAGAAELYRRGLADRVLLHRRAPGRLEALGLVPPVHETWHRLLERRGVPPRAIHVLPETVRGEWDLGRALRGSRIDARPARIIAVATSPRSRLSRDALALGSAGKLDLRIYPVPAAGVDDRGWWRSKAGWIQYFDAYCLWLVRFFR